MSWCGEPFQRLIEKRALLAYKCTGFWQCMDTFKDKQSARGAEPGRGAVEGLARSPAAVDLDRHEAIMAGA